MALIAEPGGATISSPGCGPAGIAEPLTNNPLSFPMRQVI
jgi:hypothetical protein|tara:strand:+ start:595 stop:714 length:120 start_codon:yes stop_codon:yes gene_type:complete